MSNTPVEVIMAAFPTPDGAAQAMAALQQAKSEGLIGIADMAIVVKDENGKLKITDSKHRTARGLVTGGVVGGLVGLLAGPVGLAAMGGSAVGALAGRARGLPMRAELKEAGDSLIPNSSAIVAVIEHTWVTELETALAAQGAQVIHDTIKADVAAQLNAGGNVLYSALVTDGSASAVRVADSAEKVTAGGVVTTADAVAGGRISATADRASEGMFAATDNGIYVEHATLTDEKV
jgi:uncharacterized membrane protein